MKRVFIATMISLALASCHAPKTVTYFPEAEELTTEQLATVNPLTEPTFMPGDLVNIEVTASAFESVAVFNKGKFMTAEGSIQNNLSNNNDPSIRYYLIDANGNIDFPLIGEIHLAGLKKSEAAKCITDAIYPKYIKERPTVDVRIMNFSVTVLGQVKTPGIVKSDNERLNIFEAIAKAGDLDIRGERNNVKIIRTQPDGNREVAVINLHDKDILTSPYYTLQQNDIIYVTPNRSAAQGAWQMPNAIGVTSTIVGGISGVVALILTLVNM